MKNCFSIVIIAWLFSATANARVMPFECGIYTVSGILSMGMLATGTAILVIFQKASCPDLDGEHASFNCCNVSIISEHTSLFCEQPSNGSIVECPSGSLPRCVTNDVQTSELEFVPVAWALGVGIPLIISGAFLGIAAVIDLLRVSCKTDHQPY